MGRIVAIDYGRARLGVAISDNMHIIPSISFNLEVKKTKKETFEQLALALKPYNPIDRFVVGNPLLMSGKQGEMALEASLFAKELQEQFSIEVVLWDERLTSLQADKLLKEDHLSRKQRARLSDSLAATIILQSYLENLSRKKPSAP